MRLRTGLSALNFSTNTKAGGSVLRMARSSLPTLTRPVVVFHAALKAADHPYVICVGREQEPYRMRRAAFAYDRVDLR